MERAKDLSGLLILIREATLATGSASSVLAYRQDTESQIQCASLRKIRDQLEFLGRDLAGGVIDLRELPFHEKAWTLLFGEPIIPLATEQPALQEERPTPLPPTELQDDLFDFASTTQDHGRGIPAGFLDA